MDQNTNTDDTLTPAQQVRKDIWAGALDRANIPADTIDWKQPDVATPLYAQADAQ